MTAALAVLAAAAALDFHSWLWTRGTDPLSLTNRGAYAEARASYFEYAGKTNLAERIRMLSRGPKPRTDMTPVEAFHNFCAGGKVPIPRDLRPKPYEKMAPDRRRKGPRK